MGEVGSDLDTMCEEEDDEERESGWPQTGKHQIERFSEEKELTSTRPSPLPPPPSFPNSTRLLLLLPKLLLTPLPTWKVLLPFPIPFTLLFPPLNPSLRLSPTFRLVQHLPTHVHLSLPDLHLPFHLLQYPLTRLERFSPVRRGNSDHDARLTWIDDAETMVAGQVDEGGVFGTSGGEDGKDRFEG